MTDSIEDLSLNKIDTLLDERVLLIEFLKLKGLLYEFIDWKNQQYEGSEK